jgi:hypothetical protein
MSSHVGIAGVGGYPQVKKAVAEDLGGQPHQASQILTFPLSKTCSGACRTYLPSHF